MQHSSVSELTSQWWFLSSLYHPPHPSLAPSLSYSHPSHCWSLGIIFWFMILHVGPCVLTYKESINIFVIHVCIKDQADKQTSNLMSYVCSMHIAETDPPALTWCRTTGNINMVTGKYAASQTQDQEKWKPYYREKTQASIKHQS